MKKTTMRQDFGKDTSGDVGINKAEAQSGRPMGGGKTDISHSVSGNSVSGKK